MTARPLRGSLRALCLIGGICLLTSCGGSGASSKPLADDARVTTVAFSPDGKFVAGGNSNGYLRLWDVAGRTEARTMKVQERDDILNVGLNTIVFSADGKTLISGGDDGKVRTWDVATGQEGGTLMKAATGINALALSRDGKTLAVAIHSIGNPDKRLVRLLDFPGGTETKALAISVVALAFSPDGKTLAIGDATAAALWDVATGTMARTFAEGSNSLGLKGTGYTVAFSPDGRLLASGGQAKTISIWDVQATGEKPVRTLEGYAKTYSGPIQSLTFSPDGKILASGNGEQAVKLWDPATGKELRTLAGHAEGTLAVAFSPDGKLLASGGNDKTIRLWDVSTVKAA